MMTKDNVLLYEKHDTIQQQAVHQTDDKIVMVKGTRIFRVVKPESDGTYKTLCQYDNDSDSTDLSELNNYKGYYMCSVDIYDVDNDYLIWNCVQLEDGTEDNKVFSTINNRRCTDEEIKLLEDLFPNYYEEALKFNNKKHIKEF